MEARAATSAGASATLHSEPLPREGANPFVTREDKTTPAQQSAIEFPASRIHDEFGVREVRDTTGLNKHRKGDTARDLDAIMRRMHAEQPPWDGTRERRRPVKDSDEVSGEAAAATASEPIKSTTLPPLAGASRFVKEAGLESLSSNIRPLGQLDESFIVATDDEGLLLIDQHVAHERILFDKYRALESTRSAESQHLLLPDTFDMTPAQAAVFDLVAKELESYGFELMRLSGRTVAIRATPADLPASEARNMLAEVLDTVDPEKKGTARETLRDDISASLACHAAIKVNTPLAPEKMRWLIDRLLTTSSPTTCPHGRPVILRLTTKDILKGFHRI